jgi:uncharacterized protein
VELRFKIKEISQNGTPQRHTRAIPAPLIAAVLEGTDADPTHAQCDLEVELFRDHEDVHVRGRLRGTLELPCARCVEPARVPIDVKLDAMYVREGSVDDEAEPADVEALLEEPDRFEHDGKEVVLDELVREALIAELPISCLCKPDCKGLCPQCGANQNTPEGRACGHAGTEGVSLERSKPLAGLAKVKLSS